MSMAASQAKWSCSKIQKWLGLLTHSGHNCHCAQYNCCIFTTCGPCCFALQIVNLWCLRGMRYQSALDRLLFVWWVFSFTSSCLLVSHCWTKMQQSNKSELSSLFHQNTKCCSGVYRCVFRLNGCFCVGCSLLQSNWPPVFDKTECLPSVTVYCLYNYVRWKHSFLLLPPHPMPLCCFMLLAVSWTKMSSEFNFDTEKH